jgi:transcriptional regulator with XRE-family HTH domain
MTNWVKVNLQAVDRERHLRGWSRADLARHMGVTFKTVWEIYRTGRATSRAFAKLAKAFEDTPVLPMADRLLEQPASEEGDE